MTEISYLASTFTFINQRSPTWKPFLWFQPAYQAAVTARPSRGCHGFTCEVLHRCTADHGYPNFLLELEARERHL
jgi:hypothetical protein